MNCKWVCKVKISEGIFSIQYEFQCSLKAIMGKAPLKCENLKNYNSCKLFNESNKSCEHIECENLNSYRCNLINDHINPIGSKNCLNIGHDDCIYYVENMKNNMMKVNYYNNSIDTEQFMGSTNPCEYLIQDIYSRNNYICKLINQQINPTGPTSCLSINHNNTCPYYIEDKKKNIRKRW